MTWFERMIFGAFIARFDELKQMLQQLTTQVTQQMATLADIKAKVQAEHDVNVSVIALLQELSRMVKDAQASGDPAALQEIADMLDSDTAELSAAVTANTPAETPSEPAPEQPASSEPAA